jgi:Na+/proline symporter
MAHPETTETTSEAQHVRHCYWKYPVIALVLAVALGLLGVFAGSPNSPRATIAATARQDPGGAALAFTQELAGTSASAATRTNSGWGHRARCS